MPRKFVQQRRTYRAEHRVVLKSAFLFRLPRKVEGFPQGFVFKNDAPSPRRRIIRLNRRADLNSPQSGHADPGDLVMDINVTEALPNAFGAPSIFGRRRPAGRTVVQYVGTENGTVYFSR